MVGFFQLGLWMRATKQARSVHKSGELCRLDKGKCPFKLRFNVCLKQDFYCNVCIYLSVKFFHEFAQGGREFLSIFPRVLVLCQTSLASTGLLLVV